MLPVVRFVTDADGTRWTVLFAGGYAPQSEPRHLVFRAAGLQLTAVYTQAPGTLTEQDIRRLLEQAKRQND